MEGNSDGSAECKDAHIQLHDSPVQLSVRARLTQHPAESEK